jgi:predicted phosphodiesterase
VPYLIVSDIHGNLEALHAVLEDAQGRYDRILCLGDLVGYGADPNPIVEWARANLTAIIRGNHDKVCTGMDSLEQYNPAARASALWTQKILTEENRTYLQRLARGPLPYEDIELVHGSPADEDEYLIASDDAFAVRGDVEAAVTFFGHSHVQGGFVLADGSAQAIRRDVTLAIKAEAKYLVNPGSVGQPRDRDWRAAYALYSPVERLVEYHRVAYDVDRASAKIRAAGLPEFLATRLFDGI